jgi:hypothetical protein
MSKVPPDLLVITAYYNLTNGRRRLANYRAFRRSLGVPLLTVEWHPQHRYALGPDDADLLLQVGGGDLMWQKERLLTLALAQLPSSVEYVAWIDCDVLFEAPGWPLRARESLKTNLVVQLFSEVALPGEEPHPGSAEHGVPKRQSFLSLFARLGKEIVPYDLHRRFEPDATNSYNIMQRPAYGFAWAARASFLREIGIYDRCILGGGDLLFCYGVTGLARQLIDNHKAAGWDFYGDCASYRAWAARAAEACGGRCACLPDHIEHLFHGKLSERQYKSRIDGLVPFALDLDVDIRADAASPWSWRRDRERLNAYFLKYLRDRNEDADRNLGTGSRSRTAEA